jgi:hypothetical protein
MRFLGRVILSARQPRVSPPLPGNGAKAQTIAGFTFSKQ